MALEDDPLPGEKGFATRREWLSIGRAEPRSIPARGWNMVQTTKTRNCWAYLGVMLGSRP